MPLSTERLRTAVLARLTDREVESCVVYVSRERITRGTTLSFPRLTFTCSTDGYLAFVDLDPMANWGHACCYICVDADTGDASRVDAQLPPFGPTAAREWTWEVLYRGGQ